MRKICKYDQNNWLMQDDEKNLLLINEKTNQIYDLQNNQPELSKREDLCDKLMEIEKKRWDKVEIDIPFTE